MPLSIQTNVASMAAQRSFMQSNAALETSFERLSSGKRINSAVDDAAGLSIGVQMESKVSGLNQAIRNTNDGISMVQIAEGALDEATSILQRMRDLAVQAANSSLSSTERGYLDEEQSKLATALDDVLGAAKFNGTALISTSARAGTGNVIQIGADSSDQLTVTVGGATASLLGVAGNTIDLTTGTTTAGTAEVVEFGVTLSADPSANDDTYVLTINGKAYDTSTSAGGWTTLTELKTALNTVTDSDGNTIGQVGYVASEVAGGIRITANTVGVKADSNVAFGEGANFSAAGSVSSVQIITQGVAAQSNGATAAITAIDTAINSVASDRASLGASQSQLESTVRNLANVAENTSAAVGRIMDTDYAAETANLTKAQILQQAATSILAQANAQPQSILALLQ